MYFKHNIHQILKIFISYSLKFPNTSLIMMIEVLLKIKIHHVFKCPPDPRIQPIVHWFESMRATCLHFPFWHKLNMVSMQANITQLLLIVHNVDCPPTGLSIEPTHLFNFYILAKLISNLNLNYGLV